MSSSDPDRRIFACAGEPAGRSAGSEAPRFSVVIAARNAERTIGAAVDSVLAQTETSLEVMVVDDGSDDRTAAIVAAHADPRVRVLTQPNAGPAAARNAGIRATDGDYVAVL